MSDTAPPELRLAADIAEQFQTVPHGAEVIADHIRSFWEPRMRRALLEAVGAGADVDPLVRDAVALLRGGG